ncbi:MAG: DUF4268 domain-containing protein [Chloroflexi bacterium]|nr:DUF4268 domain-containing protein [Chloroflexota bacterium]
MPTDGPTPTRPIKEATSQRERDLVAFWELAIPSLSKALPIFATTRPRPYAFITKSVRGTTYRVNIKLDDASMWVMVRGRTSGETAARFERLRKGQGALKEAFGEGIGFVGPEDATHPFIGARLSDRGMRNRDAWAEVIQDIVANAVRFYEAVQPFA